MEHRRLEQSDWSTKRHDADITASVVLTMAAENSKGASSH